MHWLKPLRQFAETTLKRYCSTVSRFDKILPNPYATLSEANVGIRYIENSHSQWDRIAMQRKTLLVLGLSLLLAACDGQNAGVPAGAGAEQEVGVVSCAASQ